MKSIRLAVVGTLVQTGLLALFMLTARTEPSGLAKSAVAVLALFVMTALLAHATRAATVWALLRVCLILAIGYSLGFHVLGMLLFPGLLRDTDGWSVQYLLATLRVSATLFSVYVFAAFVLRAARTVGQIRVAPWIALAVLTGLVAIGMLVWGWRAGHWTPQMDGSAGGTTPLPDRSSALMRANQAGASARAT